MRLVAVARAKGPARRSGARLSPATALCLFLLATSVTPAAAQPDDGPFIRPLTALDRQFMAHQRQRVDELSRRRLGSACCDSVEDLPLLQRLLDEGWVQPEERLQLQAMGIVLGDLLAAELGMDWVIYEDEAGRSRALRYRDTDNYLFPVTMISRRREAGNRETVAEIYDGARAAIEPLLPPRPYE